MSALKSAFVVGFTGATGKELVKELAKSEQFEKVVLIGRRKVEFEDEALKKFEQRAIDFDKLPELKEEFSGFDIGFCCLGTTRRAAGSAEAFRKVDFDYVHQMAQHCKDGGTKHFHYVSSGGASKNSSFLYPRVKGEIEAALADLKFERLSIYRPLMLKRGGDLRFAEKATLFLLKPIELFSPATVVTPCDLLSRAIVNNCQTTASSSSEILDNKQIYRLAALNAST